MAADLPARLPAKAPPALPPAVYNWTGLYVGLNAGYGWGSSDVSTTVVDDGTGYFLPDDVASIGASGRSTVKPRGFVGGGQVGYNWQTGNIVLGLEADFQYLGLDESRSRTIEYPTLPGVNYSLDQSVETSWLFTFRPRFGIAANNWLFYATGGLAVADIETRFTFTDDLDARATGSRSETKVGWTAGGGVEYGWGRNWTIRAEYLYARFDDVTVQSSNLNTAFGAFPQNVFTHSTDLSTHIARGAINYRF